MNKFLLKHNQAYAKLEAKKKSEKNPAIAIIKATKGNGLMQMKLEQDMAQLSRIQSIASKIQLKRDELLPSYQDYLNEALKDDKEQDHSIIVECMIWSFDIEDFEQGILLANHVIKHQINMPERFSRDAKGFVVSAISGWALSQQKLEESAEPWLSRIFEAAEKWDVADGARAEMLRAMGQESQANGEYQTALDYYQAGLKLNSKLAVSNSIKAVTKLLESEKEDTPTE